MGLIVDVLPLAPCPAVRLEVVGAGPWTVTGSARGEEWAAGSGNGPAVFADPWAPLGVPVTYTLSMAGAREVSGPVLRSFGGWHALTDLSGRSVVSFLWEKSGGDAWDRSLRASFAEPWGSRLPVSVLAPVAGAGGGSITARTTGGDTRRMRSLVESSRPLVLLHNEGRCRLPECDVPLARTVLLTGAPERLTSRMDRAERSWDLSYRLVRRPHGYLAPVVTVADVLAQWDTAADVLAEVATGAELVRGDWRVW